MLYNYLKSFRTMLLLLVIWDLAIGACALFFPNYVMRLIGFETQAEPLFVRGVGEYWLLASYFQYLGYKDPVKFQVAVHISIVYRIMAGIVDFAVAIFLLPKPVYFFHYVLLFFGVMDFLIAYLTIYFTTKLGIDCTKAQQ